jgi:hypothetical protein
MQPLGWFSAGSDNVNGRPHAKRLRKESIRLFQGFTVLIAVLAFWHPLRAQLNLGNISGTATDAQDLTLPGAKIEVRNLDTNLVVTATTQNNGSYQIPNLPIGTYSVRFSHDGFETRVFDQILVQGNRTTKVDAKLQVGGISTVIEVIETPFRNEVEATNGYVLESPTIESTPLGTGSFTQLAILSPGVNADFLPGSGTNAGLGNQAIWANGRRDTSNTFTFNGVNTNNLFNGKSSSQVAEQRYTLNTGQFTAPAGGGEVQTNVTVYNAIGQGLPTPPPEAIEELRVNTSQYDASQGGTSGAQIALITKSGTNHLHGQMYDSLQNSAFNAAPFFRKADPTIPAADKVPALHYNRFGATLGGPIKTDKSFFFIAFQGIRSTDALSSEAKDTVPQHLTDDRSPQALSAVALQDFGVNIAPAAIDPVALNLLQTKINGQYLIPSVTVTDPTVAKQLNYNALLIGPSTQFVQNEGMLNLDWNLSEKDRLSEKFFISSNPNHNPFAQSNTLGFPQTLDAGSWTVSLDNTYSLKPNLTWEQRIGVVRQAVAAKVSQSLTPQDIGMSLFGSTNFPALEIFQDDGSLKNALFIGPRAGSGFSNNGVYQNRLEWSSNANWVVGPHTLYLGFSTDYSQLNITNGATQVSTVESQTFTDFLKGTPLNSSFSYLYNGASSRYYRSWQAGIYAHDNIKIKSNLNVSVGLRYDYNGPFSEKYGLLTSFHPDAYKYDPTTDTILSSGIVIAGNNSTMGTPGVSDSTLTGRQWGVAPRIGVAWSPRMLSNVTIRAGLGMFYDRGEYFTYLSPGNGPNGTGGPLGVTLSLPFVTKVSATASSTLDVPFGSAPPPAPSNANAITALLPNIAGVKKGTGTYVFGGYDPSNTLPYVENWSLDVQWQPWNTWLFSAGYVGNHGVHEVLPIPFNQPGIATAGNPINGESSSYGFNAVPSETLKTFDGGNASLRVPYLGFNTNSVFYTTDGISNYNALQLGLRKRLSHGVQITSAYTWSHSLDEQSGLGLFFNGNDPTQPKLSYATSAYDRTHVFITSFNYDFPSLMKTRGWEAQALNGWQLSGLVTAQSGQPFNFYDFSGAVAGVYYGSFVNISDPVIGFQPGTTIPGVTLQGTTGVDPSKPYVDLSKLNVPVIQPGEKGVPAGDNFETDWANAGRNAFRGPFQSRIDLALGKEFTVTERIKFWYRLEAFNLTNHPSFDVPNNSLSLYSVSGGVPTLRAPSASAGLISHTIGSPRFLQMSLKLVF